MTYPSSFIAMCADLAVEIWRFERDVERVGKVEAARRLEGATKHHGDEGALEFLDLEEEPLFLGLEEDLG